MSNENKTKTVSLKVNVRDWEQFNDTAKKRGISKSRLFSDFVYANCYIDKQEVIMEVVNLMECINVLRGECDSYKDLREAGGKLCRSLLIK